jgi:NADPH2:quinone reductase
VKAAVCHEYGAPDVVRVEDIPSPEPTAGQVRVRINAAAVNFPDVLIVANEYQIKIPPPFVPGSEFAGTVERVGDGVTELAVGDRVFGTGIVGAFAEEVCAPVTSLTQTPDGIDDRSAAAFGVAHRTAYHVLRSVAHAQPGDEVVVLGAGGGVGLAAVQLASVLGASVTAVASSDEKLEIAKSQGATKLVNHRTGPLRDALKEMLPGGSDVVVDPVGGDLAEPALRSLRFGGRFVTVGYASGEIPRVPLNLILLKGCQIHGFQFATFGANLPDEMNRNERELLELFAAGRARPYIGATYKLDDVVEAMRFVGDGKAIGKVALDIN